MSVIDNAKTHFDSLGIKKIKVPEWGEKDKPLIIHARPMTLAEMNKLQKLAKDDDLSLLAYTLIEKALDSEGDKIFSIGDKHDLMTKVDRNVLQRVVEAKMDSPSVEEQQKK